MTEVQFGRIQMRIMQILWKRKRATTREITIALNEFEPIVHKNVQTLIRSLEDKGVIAYDVQGRTHIYYPVANHETVTKKEMRDFIGHMFQGSTENLVSSIVKNDYISSEEVKEIIGMLNEKEK